MCAERLFFVPRHDLFRSHGLDSWWPLLLVPGSSETKAHAVALPSNPTAPCRHLHLGRHQLLDRGMDERVFVARFVGVYRGVGSCWAGTLGHRCCIESGKTSSEASNLDLPIIVNVMCKQLQTA